MQVEDLELGQVPPAALLVTLQVLTPHDSFPRASFPPHILLLRQSKLSEGADFWSQQNNPHYVFLAQRQNLTLQRRSLQKKPHIREVSRCVQLAEGEYLQTARVNLKDVVNHKLSALYNLSLFLLSLKSDSCKQTECSSH